jgi:hypothetical protein
MTNAELKDMIVIARRRLVEYRVYKQSEETSIHINALEIAINLVEFSLKTNPPRPISKEEEQWFNAGRYIELILGASPWSDLSDKYYEIAGEVEGKNFFR